MKVKVTRKDLKANYKCLECGYCNLQSLLRFETPQYYATRAEGWAFDAYIFGNVAVIDGYAPIGKPVDRELMRMYDRKANEMVEEWRKGTDYSNESYEAIECRLRNLIADFIGDARQRRKAK